MTSAEYRDKRRRLLDLLDAQALDAIVLRRPANLSWYSGGGRFHIVATPEIAVADSVVTRDGERLVTTANEAERLTEEELGNLNAELVLLPWTQDRREALPTGGRVGYDLWLRTNATGSPGTNGSTTSSGRMPPPRARRLR